MATVCRNNTMDSPTLPGEESHDAEFGGLCLRQTKDLVNFEVRHQGSPRSRDTIGKGSRVSATTMKKARDDSQLSMCAQRVELVPPRHVSLRSLRHHRTIQIMRLLRANGAFPVESLTNLSLAATAAKLERVLTRSFPEKTILRNDETMELRLRHVIKCILGTKWSSSAQRRPSVSE
ncbi:hypothetical protein H310_12396 [Aphanomyces invadans]|uniref:Uncharacterized protein n=1 Tax=Aphanomyces invadans TaxID=157072 RepID=A0A024TJS2_9STRA|nr:hypothetical protein H310_12396 [Aphanomyces invadans]ETV93602.1 hypothetical protein H310_12396 [Aphanomyces invadans]|eukprot:XP_008877643.1 hypothetical protein H310_12396 [Aphanomyces invadans]